MATAKLTVEEVCRFLAQVQDVLILAHVDPDGDTLGSSYALMHTMNSLGKRAKVFCADPIAPRYSFLLEQSEITDFEPKTIIACDVADISLLGKAGDLYGDKIDLCIDHHPSNREYAVRLLLNPKACATCELMLDVVEGLGIQLNSKIADCLYTGIATDTGCFKFSNTSAKTHKIAAQLIEAGADYENINRLMFETVSRARMAVQAEAVSTLDYYFDARCAMMAVSRDSMEENHCSEDDLEGLSALPRQIEGVDVGIILRETPERTGYRVSMRTTNKVNASAVCEELGGGGHNRAAGCYLSGELSNVKAKLLEALNKVM